MLQGVLFCILQGAQCTDYGEPELDECEGGRCGHSATSKCMVARFNIHDFASRVGVAVALLQVDSTWAQQYGHAHDHENGHRHWKSALQHDLIQQLVSQWNMPSKLELLSAVQACTRPISSNHASLLNERARASQIPV
jgi:hypothetical protein